MSANAVRPDAFPLHMRHWLLKTEPGSYSIDDLRREKTTAWSGVRNYQARNFMKDMRPGDAVLFYHSSAEPAGIAGLAQVAAAAHPDETQFEKKGKYFDPKATKAKPIWFCVDAGFVKKFPRLIPLEELRKIKSLKDMILLRRGSRLSVQPVTEKDYETILKIAALG